MIDTAFELVEPTPVALNATTPSAAPAPAGHPAPTEAHRPLLERIEAADAARIALVAVGALAAWITRLAGAPGWTVAAIGTATLLASCWPIVVEAWGDLRERRMSMELSMLLAIVAAAAIGQWGSALLIALFVLVAEVLEDMCMERGRDALTGLMSFLPSTARVIIDGEEREIPLDDLAPGQVIALRPGGRVPADGVVRRGSADIDQSHITGESMPVTVGTGDHVPAGSITQGPLELEVTRAGEDSSFGRIIAAVRAAQDSRAPVHRLADVLAARIIYLALGLALITLLVTRDAQATISVVIAAGACGVAAGTPLAVLAAIARGARTGAFVKDGAHLEILSAVDTVVLDKTGTLTTGAPRVVGLRPASGGAGAEDSLLRLAAAAEWNTEHPIGQAIVERARERALDIPSPASSRYTPGMGVEALVEGRLVRVGRLDADQAAQVANSLSSPTGAAGLPAGTTAVQVVVDGRADRRRAGPGPRADPRGPAAAGQGRDRRRAAGGGPPGGHGRRRRQRRPGPVRRGRRHRHGIGHGCGPRGGRHRPRELRPAVPGTHDPHRPPGAGHHHGELHRDDRRRRRRDGTGRAGPARADRRRARARGL